MPELRQELRLERGADTLTGAPTWLVIDPVANRYIQIDETAYQLLSIWAPGRSTAEIAARALDRFGVIVEDKEIGEFASFLATSNLTIEPARDGWRSFADAASKREHGWLMWAVHNYLFIKLPLLKPQTFLDRTLPSTAIFFTRGFWTAIAVTGLVGLYLVSRQWETFTTTFMNFISWEGAAAYGLTLIAVKSLHELGHAYTAARFGCRVPSMGVCFMVLMPVLYTDVTDAWRLRSRRQRMIIDAAGMTVELGLACVATALWAFLPDGPVRGVAFSVATVGWILSLAVNLNPLMRFDGYYLLSDFLGIDNLQFRSFAFGRWRMREILFGLGAPPPEALPKRTATILVVYAWLVWLYRLVLFTGIALLVYHMTFKVLGVVLFLIEIVYFVARPMSTEFTAWWAARVAIRQRNRTWISAGIAGVLVLLMTVPWSTRIDVPAVIEAAEMTRLYPTRPAEVVSIHVTQGQLVAAGAPIVTLTSRELAHELQLTDKKIALVELRLARRGSDAEDRSKSLSLERELQSLRTKRSGLAAEQGELTVRAPHAGEVAELNLEVQPGRHITRAEPIALIRSRDRVMARGYLAEHDLARLGHKSPGRFAFDNPMLARQPVTLKSVAGAASASIEIAELASQHGGHIAVRPQSDGRNARRLVPTAASYLATFEVDPAGETSEKSERGIIQLTGSPQSFLARAWRQTLKVLVRESGV